MYTRLNKQLQALVSFCMLRVTQLDPAESQFPCVHRGRIRTR
jgi:hypothetical protein